MTRISILAFPLWTAFAGRAVVQEGYDFAMRYIGLICLVSSVVILGLFFANPPDFIGQYIGRLTKAVLFASFAVSLLAIAFNAGRGAAMAALFVDLVGLGLAGSIVDHL